VKRTYEEHTVSPSDNTKTYLPFRAAVAGYVEEISTLLDKPFQSITITPQERLGDSFAASVTVTWLDGTETEWSWSVRESTS
jgi:hypothetical protein